MNDESILMENRSPETPTEEEQNSSVPIQPKKRTLWIVILKIALSAVFLYALILAVGLLLFQRTLMYFPQEYDINYPGQFGSWTREVVEYSTDDGRQFAYALHHETQFNDDIISDESKPRIWVCFHGNASLAMDWLLVHLEKFNPNSDTRFLLIDYPGYGDNEGKATRGGIIRNGQEALASYLTENNLDSDDVRIGVVGYSIGAAAGLEFATRHDVDRIVLFAPFTSMVEMGKRTAPWPHYHLVLDRYDNRKRISELAELETPPSISIFHGIQDGIIPVQMSEELSLIAPEITTFRKVDHAGHDSIVDFSIDDFYSELQK